MNKPLTVYKASAGSGKTFTLATEYIRLVVENPQSYRNILAVTFTNKATEEMKMRILSQLYGIWKRLEESEPYMKAVQEKTGLQPHTISERAGIALANLLHNYNNFRVETIDAFFQRVLRNMARELDLTTNLRIGLNDYQVEELAVDQLIEDLNVTDVMLQWILKYIMENISDNQSWNVIGQIKRFGYTIFKDEYKAVSQQMEKRLSEPGFFENYTAQLLSIRHNAREHMKEIAESFFDTLEGEGLTVEDFSYGKGGICGFFHKLRQGIFDESIVGKRITDSLGDASKWYKKTHPRRELIHALADSTLGDILRYAIEERPRQWRLYQSADLTLRHLNQLRLLGSIEQKVHELNADANRFLLSDTQQLLHSLIDGSDSPFIFEKIGTQLEHVMIDEFQDTSTVQWQNFRVLLSEAMSHAGSQNLIVGDVKQSIYRWRSGDWRLLNDIEQQFPQQQIETLPLSTNYRSERNIIMFNNAFFLHAAELEYEAQRELNATEAEQLHKAYSDVVQNIPDKRPEAGYVQIELLQSENYQEQTLQRLSEIILQLTSLGVPQQKIAILVRTNTTIPTIAQYFIENMPEIHIVSDEAYRLDASSAVRILIDALRLLTHPDDLLTKASLVKAWQCDILDSTSNDNELLLSVDTLDNLLPEEYTRHLPELKAMPFYDLTERLYTIFGLQRLQDQNAYVFAFYDHLTNYVNENTADIEAFLEEWDENIHQKTIQSDESNGIRILTIHKSKGLEFEHVLLPFCDWTLEKTQNQTLWCQPSEKPFNDLPIAPIDYGQKKMMGTIYENDYLHEHLQNTVDNLNLLYVAFTRACRSLFVIGRRGNKNMRSLLIEQSLPLVAEDLKSSQFECAADEKGAIRFTYGSLPDSNIQPSPETKKASPNPFLQPVSPLPIAIEPFSNKVNFRQSNRSQQFIEGETEESSKQNSYIHIGSVLHEVFSTIHTADDIPEALQRLQFEGVLYDDHITAEHIKTLLHKRLEDPRVADWFSTRWTVFNECTLLSIENGKVLERRPDRVMTDGKEWVVVDFKFGTPKPEYHDQVREYMHLINSMASSMQAQVKGYLWYVYSNQIETVSYKH